MNCPLYTTSVHNKKYISINFCHPDASQGWTSKASTPTDILSEPTATELLTRNKCLTYQLLPPTWAAERDCTNAKNTQSACPWHDTKLKLIESLRVLCLWTEGKTWWNCDISPQQFSFWIVFKYQKSEWFPLHLISGSHALFILVLHVRHTHHAFSACVLYSF